MQRKGSVEHTMWGGGGAGTSLQRVWLRGKVRGEAMGSVLRKTLSTRGVGFSL